MTAQYIYDGWDVVQMISDGVTTDFVRTLNIDEPLALEQSGSTVRYFKTDALGSVIALVDPAGNVTTSYAYDAFGNVTVAGEPIDNPFQYTGRENDGTGLLHYRFRYYSPEMRRFVSEDPIGLAGGDVNLYNYVDSVGIPLLSTNLYAYVDNSPVNWIDPYGLFKYGFGGVVGIFNFYWSSDEPTYTQGEIITDLELGAGGFVCFDSPFADECGAPELPFSINIGVGKYTGISTNNAEVCVNIGWSRGFLPVDISFAKKKFRHD